MPSDLEQLLEFGFPKERAEIAVKKTGNLQGALEWLETNQDKTLDEIEAASKASADDAETDPSIEPAPLMDGEVAKSMVCNECGKKFRSMAQVEFHAGKTDHSDFAESTEEIKPLTAEEKKEALEQLKQKSAARKAAQVLVDKEEQKKNEKIRMKATKEIQDAKEELAKNEQIKAAATKRQEKLNDIAAKKRIQEKIAADKEARRLKAEQQKAEREGRAPPPDPTVTAAQNAQAGSSAGPSVRKEATEARLRLQTAGGVVMKNFPVDTTLFEVAEAVKAENGAEVESFTMTYPKKTFSGSLDFAKTLKEAGLVPSAVLIVK